MMRILEQLPETLEATESLIISNKTIQNQMRGR
jgi:hypothetical protein